jgi:hypothetical protein
MIVALVIVAAWMAMLTAVTRGQRHRYAADECDAPEGFDSGAITFDPYV